MSTEYKCDGIFCKAFLFSLHIISLFSIFRTVDYFYHHYFYQYYNFCGCLCLFSQEGWRLEPEDLNDPDSPCAFKGVVYNEMKGVYVSAVFSVVVFYRCVVTHSLVVVMLL